jgi:hypothetical protein
MKYDGGVGLRVMVKRLVARQNLAASAEDTGVPMMIGRSF